MARKYAAAKRSSAAPPNDVAQIAAEEWLKQQLKAWEFSQADIPEQPAETKKATSQTLESKKVVDRGCTDNTRPSEKPTKNARADTSSDALAVANRGPQKPAATFDPVYQPAFTGIPQDVATSANYDQLLPAVVLYPGHPDGESNPETRSTSPQASGTEIQTQPGRAHPESGHEVKTAAEYQPLFPSAVKAPDKCGQPRFSCVDLDDGVLQERQPPSGQLRRLRQSANRWRKRWHPAIPPDKNLPEKTKRTSRRW